MAEIRGTVVKVYGERAEIKVNRQESEGEGLPKYLDAWNPIAAKPGDQVGGEYRDQDDTKMKAIYYGLPISGVLAGVAFGHSLATFFHSEEEWMFVAGGIVLWEIVTISYARIFKRDALREGRQPVLYEVIVPEMVIDLNDSPKGE